ncbi:MAG: histidine kinase [Pseudomonadota bacterium]|nr:histidine kinase [Pseudomonadota bacterium]
MLILVLLTGLSGWRSGPGGWWYLQLAALVVLLLLIGMWFYHCRRSVADPLQRIAEWASSIRQGDFTARVSGEMGRLSAVQDDINRLAEWLQSLADEKSRSLENKSKSLQLLYDVSTGINQSPDVESLVSEFMLSLMEVVGAPYGEALTYPEGGGERLLSNAGDVEWFETAKREAEMALEERCITIPMQFQGRVYGEYRLYLKEHIRELPEEVAQLLSSIGRNLGMAIEKVGQEKESVRLSLVEERARMANELHDSLAQTLASLRFQVRTLDDLMHQDDEVATWTQMEKVEGILDEAHKELRHLIGQFRAPIDPGGLIPAIRKSVTRFRTETGLPIFFHHQWGDLELPQHWEVEIARIVQEALTNIRKHSGASMVRILLRDTGNGHYLVLIEDDGIGLGEPEDSEHPGEHIGLSVMQERAQRIGGELRIESEPGEGTLILLSFDYSGSEAKNGKNGG